MHYLRVPTTRALSLVVSTTATTQRPWYRDQVDAATNNDNDDPTIFGSGRGRGSSSSPSGRIPTMDDPRLAEYSVEQRREIILQMRRQNKMDPDIVISEPCAITCRVASSFTRIGHLDLFARRATASKNKLVSTQHGPSSVYHTESLAWMELEKIIWHACYREYRDIAYTPYIDTKDIASAATAFLQQSASTIATMVAEWIRVGFAQYVHSLRSFDF
jgi:uncharacterized protein YdiU (UPF0061 family)